MRADIQFTRNFEDKFSGAKFSVTDIVGCEINEKNYAILNYNGKRCVVSPLYFRVLEFERVFRGNKINWAGEGTYAYERRTKTWNLLTDIDDVNDAAKRNCQILYIYTEDCDE